MKSGLAGTRPGSASCCDTVQRRVSLLWAAKVHIAAVKVAQAFRSHTSEFRADLRRVSAGATRVGERWTNDFLLGGCADVRDYAHEEQGLCGRLGELQQQAGETHTRNTLDSALCVVRVDASGTGVDYELSVDCR